VIDNSNFEDEENKDNNREEELGELIGEIEIINNNSSPLESSIKENNPVEMRS
jgi:hypothetical protein